MYQPKTGAPCACKRGVQRDNCPECEGTGQRIDFAAVRARGSASRPPEPATLPPFYDRPCAAAPLVSYRCRGNYGWIMIGAKDDADAWQEALRSSEFAKRETLEVWGGEQYQRVPIPR